MSSESQKICFGCKQEFADGDKIHQIVYGDVTYSIHAKINCATAAVREIIPDLHEPNSNFQLLRENLLVQIFKHICP